VNAGARRLPKKPSIRIDREWSRFNGGALVAGVDEAGRGPLAGPVVAAAVVFDFNRPRPIGLQDSKLLTARQREGLFGQIQRRALAWAVGVSDPGEIDAINILEASRLAAWRAILQLDPAPGALVTDALDIPAAGLPTHALPKADRISSSVAAASILAKVTRDRMMEAWRHEFPMYGWERNKGYPTEDHYAALRKHGPCVLHRLSFSGVDFFCVEPRRSASFERLAARIAAPHADLGSIEKEIELLGERLPRPDAEELDRLLARARAEARLLKS